MNNMWKIFAGMAVGYLRIAGMEYKAKDADNVGKDDAIGASLIYAADLIDAVLLNKTLPKAPESLR